jgi:hypothetical protein
LRTTSWGIVAKGHQQQLNTGNLCCTRLKEAKLQQNVSDEKISVLDLGSNPPFVFFGL